MLSRDSHVIYDDRNPQGNLGDAVLWMKVCVREGPWPRTIAMGSSSLVALRSRSLECYAARVNENSCRDLRLLITLVIVISCPI